MKNFQKFYKNKFDKITISQTDEENIMSGIIKKYSKRKIRIKLCLSCFIIFTLCITSLSVVYAKEIMKFVKGFIIETRNDEKGNIYIKGETEFVKEMNYDADIPEIKSSSEGNSYSIDELENILNMKFLKSKYMKFNDIKQFATNKKDGKISNAAFVIYDFTQGNLDDGFKCNLTAYFSTKYSDNNSSSFSTSPGAILEEYNIKNLNSNSQILILNQGSKDDIITFAIAHFIYDDVGYDLRFTFTPRAKQNEALQKIKNILDSFSY